MSVEIVPLCRTARAVNREGQVGPNAHFPLPFLFKGNGLWFASGAEVTFPSAIIPESNLATIGGLAKGSTVNQCGGC